ncbi:hypothetical protein M426DRAFT_321807 [Hypoxylon sp. CI-4A]|nr:hypothetical protein M426DRAFT_321807 [Hypoxylon sp. CI-4A]
MLTTAPCLRTRRPSPTTAEFVVSTLPPPTLPLRIAHGAIHLLRLILAFCIMLLLYSSWSQSPYASTLTTATAPLEKPSPPVLLLHTTQDLTTPEPSVTSISVETSTSDTNNSEPSLLSLTTIQQTLQALLSTPLFAPLKTLSSSIPPWILLPASLATLYLLSLRIGVEERLLVLRGLGIQTSSSGATVFSSLKTRFIPTDKIQDVLIHEAFRGFEVRHSLIVIVEEEAHVVVVFPKLLPRPRILEVVWRGVRECLYEYDGGGGGGGGGVNKGDGKV